MKFERPYLRLRKDLSEPIYPLILNENYRLKPFEPPRDIAPARQVLNESYQSGEGSIQCAEDWWSNISNDPEFDLKLLFCVVDGAGNLVGVAHSWTSGFLKDLAVSPEHRRFGIGRFLVNETFRKSREFGLTTLDLKVVADNQSGAIALYRAMGMVEVFEDKEN